MVVTDGRTGNFNKRFRKMWRRLGDAELVLCNITANIVLSSEQQQMSGENIQNTAQRKTHITGHNPSQDFNISNFLSFLILFYFSKQ